MRYYCLILYDATGTQVQYTDNNEFNETSGFRTDLHEVDLEKGDYYLRVTGYKYGTSHESTGNYAITINATQSLQIKQDQDLMVLQGIISQPIS